MYPHERSLVEKYPADEFAIVGVNSERTIEAAQEVIKKNKSLEYQMQGKGKLNKVKQWMNKNGFTNFENTTFYSDSINDLPLLLEVSNPIGVNPDEQLRTVCWEANWEIIELPIH